MATYEQNDQIAIAAGGRITLDEHLRDDLWAGYERGARTRAIVILAKDLPYSVAREDLDAMLAFDVPGIARLAFAGYPDGDASARPPVLVAEVRPDGTTLLDAEPLADGEVVRLGIALCDTIIGWAERCESLTAGLRPETVYVAGQPGERYYAGATPRVFWWSWRSGGTSSYRRFRRPGSPTEDEADDPIRTRSERMPMGDDSDEELRTAAGGRIAIMDHMHGAVWTGRRFGPRAHERYARSRA